MTNTRTRQFLRTLVLTHDFCSTFFLKLSKPPGGKGRRSQPLRGGGAAARRSQGRGSPGNSVTLVQPTSAKQCCTAQSPWQTWVKLAETGYMPHAAQAAPASCRYAGSKLRERGWWGEERTRGERGELTVADGGALNALDLASGTDRASGTRAAELVATDRAPGLAARLQPGRGRGRGEGKEGAARRRFWAAVWLSIA